MSTLNDYDSIFNIDICQYYKHLMLFHKLLLKIIIS